MNRAVRFFILAAFALFVILPFAEDHSMITPMTYDPNYADIPLQPLGGEVELAGDQDEATWWNSTFIYRRYYNFTEPGVSDRTGVPVHLYLTFEDGHCYTDSIRVMHYLDPTWEAIPFQTWNTTIDGEFIQSTRVSFLVNVSAGTTDGNYYIYYAKTDVGSVSFPSFYPFIYRTYTFSLINIVSYYDNNNYTVEMYDTTDNTWKDPNNVDDSVDTRWKNSQVTPSSDPDGTLNRYDVVRYEPSATDYDDFWGFYTVYSNYPMAVTAGIGDKNSNTAVNDWYPGVDQLGTGLGTEFILGGVEGFESRNEGKYWVQAHEDDTVVTVFTTGGTLDTGWKFYNNSDATFPVTLDAGEYVSKRDVVYTTYYMANSSKPVSVRAGDSDCSYARDIGAYFPSTTGGLVGDEFYTIDMGHSRDDTRITNIGSSDVTVEWWRSTGSGWVKGTDLNIPVNSSAKIANGVASSSNPEDILWIKGPVGAKLTVEGVYNSPSVSDWGDWAPSMTGKRFGTDFRIYGGSQMKFFIMAWEDTHIDVTGSNDASYDLLAGEADVFIPLSSSHSLYNIESDATISVVIVGRFSTSPPYNPSGDQGYGWMVPTFSSMGDEAGYIMELGDEIKLFEFDITVVDLDDKPVEDVTVTLYNTDDSLWTDDNGLNRTGTTDANGVIVFEGLSNQTYRIKSRIDAASWLTTSYTNIWMTDSRDELITGSVTDVTVTLNMASVDIHLEDLMGDSMNDNPDEDIFLRLNNLTGTHTDYVAQAQANSSGWVHFNRVPQDDYKVYARYAGSLGWTYSYDDLDLFASWTISSAEFSGGDFTHSDWVLPLITLDIHVTSWDDLDVEGATIKINNTVDENAYSITKTSDVNGNYSFYRIVNGTWKLDVWKDDDYSETPTARNNTVTLVDLQDYYYQDMQLPISRLIVRVYQESFGNWVENAQVNVTLRGFDLVAQGLTNSTGHLTFFNFHANLSSPYSVSYNLTVKAGDQENGTLSELIVKVDYDWTYVNLIRIEVPAYTQAYTELNSTVYFLNLRWGESARFTIGYFDRDGDGSTTSPVTNDSSTYVNFTIYFDGSPVGSGGWMKSGNDWVDYISTINFTVLIDTEYWSMDASDTAYEVVFFAHTDGYDDPDSITVYVTVQAALTSEGYTSLLISEYYSTHAEHLFWMEDITNSSNLFNVTTLDVYTYRVKFGTQTIRTGSLIDNINGTYSLPDSALVGIDVGTYILIITLEKANYNNLSITVDAVISELPMEVVIDAKSPYEWSLGSESVTFEYTIQWNGTNPQLQSVTVQIEWSEYEGTSYLNISLTLSAVGDKLTYTFDANILPVGQWDITVTCSKANYLSASDTYSFITVTEAQSTATVFGSSTDTVDWSESAVFEVDYIRTGDSAGLSGASVNHNWTSSVIVNYLGSGRYSISIDSTVPAASYIISLNFTLDNHEMGEVLVQVDIRVPLLVESDYASEETPLIAFWTRTFDIEVVILDNSRTNTNLTGATVTYSWFFPFVIDQSGPVTHIGGGVYRVTLNAFDATPLEDLYEIEITAEMGGAVNTTATVFVQIVDVPNEIVLDLGVFNPYYADIVTVRFYWNNTLDNLPIATPSDTLFLLDPLGVEVSTLLNLGNGTYTLTVDTKALGMNVDDFSGVYSIRITMTASGFQAHAPTFVVFVMKETPTDMLAEPVTPIEWSEDITVVVNLTDIIHDELVWTGANVELVIGTDTVPMTSHGNGSFTVTFPSEAYFASSLTPYDVTVRYTMPNYVDGEIEIQITVNPLPSVINMAFTPNLEDGTHTMDWDSTIDISFQIWLAEQTGINIPEALAQYYWVGYEFVNGTFDYDPGATLYNLTLDAGEIIAGVRTLRILATLQNYTVAPFDVVITVTPLTGTVTPSVNQLESVFTSGSTETIGFTTSYSTTSLPGATISFDWGGQTWTATETTPGAYNALFQVFSAGLSVPDSYELTVTTALQNYTFSDVTITLDLLAPTEFIMESVNVEADQTVTVYFQFWDIYNNVSVPSATITVQFPDETTEVTPEYDATTQRYRFTVSAPDVGTVRTAPYEFVILAEADGYQAYTSVTTENTLEVFIVEPTYNIPLIGPIPRVFVNQALFLTVFFLVIAAAVVGIRRYRVPYQIKQINKAQSAIEKGKTPKVDGIKAMGTVVSDLLAPGLAALDIAAPVIEAGPIEEEYAEVLGEEAEELLEELDALDDIGAEEAEVDESDFEEELAAELDAIVEEEVEPEEEVKAEEKAETEAEEAPAEEPEPEEEAEEPESEAESEAEEPEMSDAEEASEAEEVEEQPETEEPAEEFSDEAEDTEEQDEADEEVEAEEEVDEEAEAEAEEAPAEEPEPEEEVEEPESEVEPEADELEESDVEEGPEVEEETEEPLTKKELIDRLPDEVKEAMDPDELKKLSKKELEALLDETPEEE